MYTFSSKLKNLSFILMLLGALGIGYGFFTAPKNTKDVEAILASSHGEHHEASASETTHEAESAHKEEVHATEVVKDSATLAVNHLDSIAKNVEEGQVVAVATAVHETHEAKTNDERNGFTRSRD